MLSDVGVPSPPNGLVGPADARVETERVFCARDWAAFAVLSAVLLLAVLEAAAATRRTAGLGVGTLLWLPVSLAGAVGFAMYLGRWATLPLMRRPVPAPVSLAHDGPPRIAVVTTFVPGSEPVEMLRQSVRAMVAMRLPHDTWVLDEGGDPHVAEVCRRLGARHFTRRGVARYQRSEGVFQSCTKHGNYNAWLDAVGYDGYEVIVNFDPDHVPGPAFLERTIGYLDDPSIGYVQAAQGYYNQSESLVARGAAEETYTYYASVQMSSFALGYPIVTGCHTVHRTAALREVGGFAAHEADDLLVTVLYRSKRWRGVYVPELLALGLVPADWSGYINQQRRWARSVLDVKLRVFPRLAKELPLVERVVSLCHGLYYLHGVSSALFVVVLAAALATGLGPDHFGSSDLLRMALLVGTLVATDLFRQRFLLDRRREFGLHWRSGFLRFAKWPYVLVALVDALRNRYGAYEITPKRRASGGSTARRLAAAHAAAGSVVALGLGAGLVTGRLEVPAAVVAGGYLVATASVVVVALGREGPGRAVALDPRRYAPVAGVGCPER